MAGVLWGLTAPGLLPENVLPVRLSALLNWILWAPWLVALLSAGSWRQRILLTLAFALPAFVLWFGWFTDIRPLDWMGIPEPWGLLVGLMATGAVALAGAGLLMLWMVLWCGLTVPAGHQPGMPHWLIAGLCAAGFGVLAATVMALYRVNPFWVPLALPAYTQTGLHAVCILAGWLGVNGLNALILTHNAWWAVCIGRQGLWRGLWPALAGSLLVVALALTGLAVTEKSGSDPLSLPVMIVQADLPIAVIRSTAANRLAARTTYLASLQKIALQPGTLVVLPEEGALPGVVAVDAPENNPFYAAYAQLARQKQVSVVTGAITRSPKTGDVWNSLILISPSGPAQYHHKVALVPFGETTPLIPGQWVAALLKVWGIDYSDGFSVGYPAAPLSVKAMAGDRSVTLAGLVCFELLETGMVSDYRQDGAQLLVAASNLGWFHGNRQLSAEYFAAGRVQAAANRLPLVLASNTGVSALVDGHGQTVVPSRHQAMPNGQDGTGGLATRVMQYSSR